MILVPTAVFMLAFLLTCLHVPTCTYMCLHVPTRAYMCLHVPTRTYMCLRVLI